MSKYQINLAGDGFALNGTLDSDDLTYLNNTIHALNKFADENGLFLMYRKFPETTNRYAPRRFAFESVDLPAMEDE